MHEIGSRQESQLLARGGRSSLKERATQLNWQIRPMKLPVTGRRTNRKPMGVVSVGTVVGTMSILTVLGLWEVITAIHAVSPIVLPAPYAVVQAFNSYIGSGRFGKDALASGEEFVLGYSTACTAGIAIGVLIGYYQVATWIVNPFLSIGLAVPIIACAPLMLVWLGIGLLSKVAVIFLICFFPVVLNTATGTKNIDRNIVRMANSFCTSDRRYFATVALPSSFPHILTGMRLAIGGGLIGVFVSELALGSTNGIGTMIVNAGAQLQTPLLFVGLIIFGAMGLILTSLLLRWERHFSVWKG